MTPVYKFSTARSIVGPNTYYSSMLAENSVFVPPAPPSYDLLQTEILTGPQATVSFSSLNSTYGSDYQHLQLRLSMQDTDGLSNMQNLFLKLNGGSSSRTHYLEGDGSAVTSDTKTDNYIRVRNGFTKGGDTYGFSASVIDILDAFHANKNKTVRYISGNIAGSGDTKIALGSGFRADLAPLDTIVIDGNDNIKAGSRLSLYGIKAA